MLIFLSLSLLGSFAFFLWSLIRVYLWEFPQRIAGLPPSHEEVCEKTIFPFLPVIFLAVAVILNIDKWLYFYFRIMAEYKGGTSKHKRNLEFIELSSKQNTLNFIHIGIAMAYVTFMVSMQVYGCAYSFSEWSQWITQCYAPMVICTAALFALLSLVFLATALTLLRALSEHFRHFYKKFRRMLITVTVLMTVPLAFRAVLDGLKAMLPWWAEWIDSSTFNNSLYNLFFFLLTTYIPIIS